jgi:hypothetical protein
MRKLLALLSLLLSTCSPLPAQQPAPTSPESSGPVLMVPLATCEAELNALEQKSLEQLRKVETDFAQRLRISVEAAAADAARPLLIELAAERAAREALTKTVRQLQWAVILVPPAVAVAAFLVARLVLLIP